MSNLKIKELIICVITLIVLILVTTTNIFASNIEDLLGNNSNNTNYNAIEGNTNIPTNNNIVNNVTNTNKVNTNVNANKNVNTNSNTNKVMPNTGIDYSVLFIVAICGVSAIFAYKKIRDYNV